MHADRHAAAIVSRRAGHLDNDLVALLLCIDLDFIEQLLFHGALLDLDFDLDTDSRLVQGYAWLRDDELRETIRQRAQVPVQPALAKGRELLLSGLNRKLGDAVTMSATVDSVAVKGLFVTRDALVVRAEATGQARFNVKQR